MDETYIGWDGETYPWPPPDGWYQASDGRYWAPDTGPNPPPAGAGAVAAGATAPSSPVDAATSQLDDSQPVSAFSTPPPAGGLQPDGPTTDEQPVIGAPGAFPGAAPAGGPPGFQPPGAPGDKSSSGASRLLLVGLGIIGAIVVVGGAIIFIMRGGDDTATDGTTTTAEDGAEETASEDGDATTTSAETDDSGGDAADTTEADDSSTTTVAEVAGDPEAFREILTTNGLSSDQLTDEQIESFGETYCGFANLSEDEDDFQDLRQSTIDEAESDLSDEGLGTIIDAAVVVFCPDEAARLNVG